MWQVVPHAVFILAVLGFIGWLWQAPNRLPPQLTHMPEAQLTIGEHNSVTIKPVAKSQIEPAVKTQKDEIQSAKHAITAADGKPAAPQVGEANGQLEGTDASQAKPLDGATNGQSSPIANEVMAVTPQSVDNLLKALIQPGMSEDSPYGPLPHKDANGRSPWQIYSRPFPAADPRPRIAIVLTDFGYQQGREQNLIAGLPRDVTLAFTPYGADILTLNAQARQLGFETLLQLDLDAGQISNNDAGPLALRNDLDWPSNQIRLYQTLGKSGGYCGILGQQGNRFLRQENNVQPLMAELSQRGLLWVEPPVAESASLLSIEQWQLPYTRVGQILDAVQDPDAVDLAMADLLAKAKSQGRAVGIAHATPLMQERLVAWQRRFADANVVLAPVSAVVQMGAAGQISSAVMTAPVNKPVTENVPVAPISIVPTATPPAATGQIQPAAPLTNDSAIVPHSAPAAAPTAIVPPATQAPTSIASQPSPAAEAPVSIVPPTTPAPVAPTSITPPAPTETLAPPAQPSAKANTAIVPNKH